MADEYASLKNVAWQYRVLGWLVGIAIAVLELKRGIVDIGEGVRQNIGNLQSPFLLFPKHGYPLKLRHLFHKLLLSRRLVAL